MERGTPKTSPLWALLAITWTFVLGIQVMALVSRSGTVWIAVALLCLAGLGLAATAALWIRSRRR